MNPSTLFWHTNILLRSRQFLKNRKTVLLNDSKYRVFKIITLTYLVIILIAEHSLLNLPTKYGISSLQNNLIMLRIFFYIVFIPFHTVSLIWNVLFWKTQHY